MGDVKNFRDLKVWQSSMDLTMLIYRTTSDFPADERFGLVMQMRRAAVSISSNIAEGHSRNSTGEFIQALGIAKGSLAEPETQAELAQRLHFLSSERHRELDSKFAEIGRMLHGHINSLRSKS